MKNPLQSILLCVLFLSLFPSSLGTCGGLQGDVVFILDASGSVQASNFQLMLQFVNDLVQDFDVGSDMVRVGVVKYASSVYTELNLHDHFNKTAVQTVISNIVYTSGLTYTAQAIAHTRTHMFAAAQGDREDIPNIAIVITDGVSSTSPSAAAADARAANITIFSIGVGTGVSELNDIASDPDSEHVFTVATFSGLSNIAGAFQTKACTGSTFLNTTTDSGATTGATDTSSDSGSTAAIVGGAVAGVAALGAAGAIGGVLYSKMAAAKTAVKTVNTANVELGNQQPKPQNTEPAEPEMSIPGMIDAPAQIQPMDTRWPARLPPLRI